MFKIRRYFFLSLVAAFVAWGLLAAFDLAGQRKLFYEEGEEELYDFWMPRMCLEQGYIGHPERYGGLVDVRNGRPIGVDDHDVVLSGWYTNGSEAKFITGWRDKVYPYFALLPLRPFPATRFGGYLWSAVAGMVLLASLCLIARSWWPLLFALSMPFLFNLERGNPVWLSAACSGVFIAWWDDEKEWKRLVAATCLAVAGAMKIAPLALGTICFSKWRWRPILLCAILMLAFVLVPWFVCEDGIAAFPVMLRNAAEHAEYGLRTSDFGLIQLWRTVRLVLGLNVLEPWAGMMVVARISQLLGFACLLFGAFRRNYILLMGGMLVAAGNMYYYAALYMIPVLVIELKRGTKICMLDLLLWFALLCPLQLIILGRSANQVIGNLATLSLMAISLARAPKHNAAKLICQS